MRPVVIEPPAAKLVPSNSSALKGLTPLPTPPAMSTLPEPRGVAVWYECFVNIEPVPTNIVPSNNSALERPPPPFE
jgi:hypothetical protein